MKGAVEEQDLPLPIVLASVLLPVCAATLSDCLYHVLHVSYLVSTSVGPRGLVYGAGILLTPFLIVEWCVLLKLGFRGALSALAGSVLALFVILRFRGSYYWPGSFDMVDWGKTYTLIPFVLGAAVGALLSKFVNLSPKVLVVMAIVVAVSAQIWATADANRDIGLYTLYAYTRHIALFSVLSVGVLCYIVAACVDRFAVE